MKSTLLTLSKQLLAQNISLKSLVLLITLKHLKMHLLLFVLLQISPFLSLFVSVNGTNNSEVFLWYFILLTCYAMFHRMQNKYHAHHDLFLFEIRPDSFPFEALWKQLWKLVNNNKMLSTMANIQNTWIWLVEKSTVIAVLYAWPQYYALWL